MSLITVGKYAPEDILPYAYKGASPKSFEGFDGTEYLVGMGSQRYLLFQQSLTCCCCGITGNTMLLQCTARMEPPHFNLYHITSNEYTLMTKDHILPHSRGGKNVLENYQTMCEVCNSIKGFNIIDLGTLLEARHLYTKEIERGGTAKSALNISKRWLDMFCGEITL